MFHTPPARQGRTLLLIEAFTPMAIYACRKCGGRLIFRMCVRTKNGKVIHTGKPIPIHLDGSCGQMLLPVGRIFPEGVKGAGHQRKEA